MTTLDGDSSLPGAHLFSWPEGFSRIPNSEWTRAPIDDAGENYDRAGRDGWRRSFDPIVSQALAVLETNDVLLDFSCGTGPVTECLLSSEDRPIGVLNVDPSAKLLRVAVEKFRGDDRAAFRLLEWLSQDERLELLTEVVDGCVLERVKVLASTNSVHLYQNPYATFKSWFDALRPGSIVLIASGNIRNTQSPPDSWILGDMVIKIGDIVANLVKREPAFTRYRRVLENAPKMSKHRQFRDSIFPPPRMLESYLENLAKSGFEVLHTFEQTTSVPLNDFAKGVSTYHEGVLSWIGGSEKVESISPTESAVQDRLFFIRYALETLFPGSEAIPFTWTYITCRR
ncbi:hypothetical protein [Haloechinothrix salitolerans]|uniref:Class I SAM-dependent methyltransferase n=1 Tax=Haloechinothrix salitolerans TaxID=926830 RepID=A0ABW2BZW2_9PSEU